MRFGRWWLLVLALAALAIAGASYAFCLSAAEVIALAAAFGTLGSATASWFAASAARDTSRETAMAAERATEALSRATLPDEFQLGVAPGPPETPHGMMLATFNPNPRSVADPRAYLGTRARVGQLLEPKGPATPSHAEWHIPRPEVSEEHVFRVVFRDPARLREWYVELLMAPGAPTWGMPVNEIAPWPDPGLAS